MIKKPHGLTAILPLAVIGNILLDEQLQEVIPVEVKTFPNIFWVVSFTGRQISQCFGFYPGN